MSWRLSQIADLDRCQLYLMVFTELTNLHVKMGWKRGNPICRVISPLQNTSIQHLQESDNGQVILLDPHVHLC
jgi:hypothetical protein